MEDELVRWYDQNQDDSAIVKASFYATSELKPPEFDREVSRSHEQHRADMAKHIEAMASYLEEIKAPAIAALEKDGATEIYSARLSPVIVAHVPRSLITKNAKNTTLFSSIGHAKGGVKLHSKIATEAAEINQYYQQSMQGDGYKIAVVEPGEVYFNNSYILSPTVRRVNKAHNSWTDCDSGPDTDHCELFLERHATFVAGMASSYYLFWSVGAPLVDVVSANWSGNDFEPESYVTAAMDWAVSTQNSDILNHSYGCAHPNGQFYCGSTLPYHREYLVNNYYITSVHSAGNAGEEGWESGCQDFNSICVGAHSDANTSRYTNPPTPACLHTEYHWIAPLSSYTDPSWAGDRELPYVTAPGYGVSATREDDSNLSDWFCRVEEYNAEWPSFCDIAQDDWISEEWNSSGTSFSAPVVSALATLMMEQGGTTHALYAWPEKVMAGMMATATNDTDCIKYGYYNYNCPYVYMRRSEWDGAGGVNAMDAYSLISAGNIYSANIQKVADGTDVYTIYKYIPSGYTVRAAVAWLDDVQLARSNGNWIRNDFDLRIYNYPYGSLLDSSTSWMNNWEIVEYPITSTGWYRFTVQNHRWRGSNNNKYIAFAVYWFPRSRTLHGR